jgi:hypothetical protein
MPDSAHELVEKMEALERIEETVARRMATFTSEEEKREADSLIKRAFSGKCEFDHAHRAELVALAIAPDEESWQFKVRERIHRFLHHR